MVMRIIAVIVPVIGRDLNVVVLVFLSPAVVFGISGGQRCAAEDGGKGDCSAGGRH
jgi:hypothetical protein